MLVFLKSNDLFEYWTNNTITCSHNIYIYIYIYICLCVCVWMQEFNPRLITCLRTQLIYIMGLKQPAMGNLNKNPETISLSQKYAKKLLFLWIFSITILTLCFIALFCLSSFPFYTLPPPSSSSLSCVWFSLFSSPACVIVGVVMVWLGSPLSHQALLFSRLWWTKTFETFCFILINYTLH